MERRTKSTIVVTLGMGLFAGSAPALADRPSASGFYVGTAKEFEAGSGIIDTFDAQLDVDDDGGPVSMTLFAQTRPDTPFHDVVVNDDLSFTALNDNDQVVSGSVSGDQVTLSICLQAPECEDHIEFTGSRAPHGACCLPDGTCTFDSEDFCTSIGGVYHGDNTTCENVDCTGSGIRWINPAGGAFAVDSNWDAQRAPTSSDTAIVDLGGTMPINFTDTATALKLEIQNTSVDLFGGTLTLLGNSELLASLSIGNGADVALHEGAIVCAGDIDVGDVPGGGLSALELLGDNAGVRIPALSTPGRISVGFLAPGRLQVTNGMLTCDTLAFGTPSLGGSSASSADFEGAFSRSNSADQVILGQSGPSTLTIGGGASLQSSGATLGAHSPSTAVVQGAGFPFGLATPSAWTVNELRVGDSAQGTLEIRDGANVNSGGAPNHVQVGPGSILVTGASGGVASNLTTETLVIGSLLNRNDAGSMTVEAGGEVIADDVLAIGAQRAPASVTIQTGGRIQAEQLLVGSDSQPAGQTELALLNVIGESSNSGPAELTVDSGAALGGSNAQLTLSAGAHANFNGGLAVRPFGRAVFEAIGPDTFATVTGLMKVAGKSASAAASVVVQNGAAVSQAQGESATLQVGDSGTGGTGDIRITHPSSGANDTVTAQMDFDNINLLLGKISVEGVGKLIARDHLSISGGELNVSSNVADFADVKCDTLAIAAAQTPATVSIQNGGKIVATNLQIGSNDLTGGSPPLSQLGASKNCEVDFSGPAAIAGGNSEVNLSTGVFAVFGGGLTVSGQAIVNASDLNTVAGVTGRMVVGGVGPNSIATVHVQNGAVFSEDFDAKADLQVGSDSGDPGFISIDHPVTGFDDPKKAQMLFRNTEIKNGTILVTGAGRCGAEQRITVDANSVLNVNTNLLDFVNVTADTLVIKAGGLVRCCPSGRIAVTTIVNEVGATIQGDTHVTGNVVTSGLVRVGCSPGLMTIEGDYAQTADGTLEIEVAGLDDGQFDVLTVTGNATLDGKVEVHFLNGFLPKQGDSVDFLQVTGSVTGSFAQISFPELAEGFNADLALTDDGKLRLTARTDAIAGQGTSLTPPTDLTAASSAPGVTPAACGAGTCGAGVVLTLGFTLAGLAFMRRAPLKDHHKP